jgi:hypothetical protein
MKHCPVEDIRIINAIKSSVSEHTINWAKETKCEDDNVFCENNGVTTSYISEKLNLGNTATRTLLNKYEKRGLIHKSKRNGGSSCRWWPAGYLHELKQAL